MFKFINILSSKIDEVQLILYFIYIIKDCSKFTVEYFTVIFYKEKNGAKASGLPYLANYIFLFFEPVYKQE